MAIGNPSFDVFKLSDEHDELRAVLRDLCEKEIAPYAADVDEKAALHRRGAGGAERVGLLGDPHPRGVRRPGRRLGRGVHRDRRGRPGVRVVVADPDLQQARHDGHAPAGSEELKKQVLPSIGAGEATASYALSEREAGSDAAAMRTRAKADGDDWVLNGSKCWISNGGHSQLVHRDGGDRPGQGRQRHLGVRRARGRSRVSRSGPRRSKMGIKGSPTTELYFEDCRIPGDRIIGEPGTGFKTALATLDHTRPTIGAQAVGIAQGALDAAIAYTKERKQFGKSISDFQGVQFMLADMAMKIEAARLMVYTAAARAERGEPDLGFISSAAKCFASDVAMEVTTDAVQLFGGYGYTVDFPVERFMRDAKITQIYEGTNQIQRVVMSRALLK